MIEVTYYAELTPEMAANQTALAILRITAEREAVAHGYQIVGDGEVGDGPTGSTKIVVWKTVSALD